MASEYQLTLNDYLSILRRRALLMTGVFAGIFATAVVVAIVVPPLYQSTGTIMVESQQISTDFVEASGAGLVDERIAVITQRVMTRENLLKIIEKYQLFEDRYVSLTTTEKTDELRTLVGIEPISVDTKTKGKATIAFKVTYEDRNPEVAYRVANDLVTLFLDENVRVRTQRATETTEFLTQEAEKLKAELDNLESQLATYKQRHGNALPEHLDLRMNMIARAEADLKDVERERSVAQEELRFLDVELSAAKSGLGSRPVATPVTSPQQELSRLKADYAKLSASYSESHPDVRAMKRKIDALEAAQTSSSTAGVGKGVNEQENLDVARVQAKIAAAQTRINSLASQAKILRARLAQYESQVIQTPQVERGLVTLMRDHESAQKKYEEMRAKLMNAKIAGNLEGENKAERFSLLEPPVRPDKPVKPDRKKMVALGFFLALAGSGGLAMMLETVNQRVRGASALTLVLHHKPLVSIPYIVTQAESTIRRRWLKRGAVIVGVVLVILLLALHIFYMPLDILILKIMARFE
jgi:polysaccharide chain length determinant protein (PEP-CTERM system associated)